MLGSIKRKIISTTWLVDSVLFNFVYLFYLLVKHYVKSGFCFYSCAHFKAEKASDTLVILGAGATINELSERQLDCIKGFDVAGLSYSAILPIEQRFYFYECPSDYQVNSMKEYANKLIPAVEEGARTAKLKHLVWKNAETKVFSEYADMKPFSRPIVCSILANDRDSIRKILAIYDRFRLFRLFLIQKRGSASALVQLSRSLGYSKVIFVGVDLNSGGYFFVNNPEYASYGFQEPYSLEGATPKIHRTNDASRGLPILEVMKVMFAMSPDIEFCVSSANSELSKVIPVWQGD